MAAALRILSELGVQLHPQKTRIVHVRQGFEFLGYKVKRGKQLQLPPGKIRGAQSGALYAIPREKSARRFMDQVRALTVPGPRSFSGLFAASALICAVIANGSPQSPEKLAPVHGPPGGNRSWA